MSILIVDDSANSRLVTGTYLKIAGHKEIKVAVSAFEAFEFLGMINNCAPVQVNFDLILMDVDMPKMSGIEACYRIKMEPSLRDIPIIMITGDDEKENLQRAFDVGAMDYITKPVDKLELQARVSSALALKQEIDSRKCAYQELEIQFLQTQKLATLGTLVAGIAHDFNNTLTIIMGYSQIGVNDLPPQHKLRSNLSELLKASEHATALTRQLLALSRRQKPEPRVIDLNDIVADISRLLRRVIGEDIELLTLLDPGAGKILTDPNQIEQVLMNLAINARDAMPQGGKIEITTQSVCIDEDSVLPELDIKSGKYSTLVVKDTGTGMSEEVKSHIFEAFFTTKDSGHGTGLGLATCNNIIKDNGGYITVDSEVGQGTTFTVYLPEVERSVDYAPETEDVGFPTGGNETILVAEDEPALREMVSTILQDQGYTVLQAQDGREALLLLQNHINRKIDLLLADVLMPHINGLELAQRLGTICPGTKVLLTSGYGDNCTSFAELGQDFPFVQKPFLPATLAKKVREILDERATDQS